MVYVVKYEIAEGNSKNYYNVKFLGYGTYINNEAIRQVLEENVYFYAYSKEELQNLINVKVKEYEIEVQEIIILNAFKDNLSKYGYPITLAIKEVMESGFKVGFHYNLMGCASIDKINSKSFTITDIMNRKNYVTKEYLQSLLLSQFYVTKK